MQIHFVRVRSGVARTCIVAGFLAVALLAAGLGLGLFIVRNLVRRQGGRVVARSEGSGEGSRFVVTLRAAAEDA